MRFKALVGSLMLLGMASHAFAQVAQKVEITGSSIKRLADEGALPLEVISAADIKQMGLASAEQLLGVLSANSANVDNAISRNNVFGAEQDRLTGSEGTLGGLVLQGRKIKHHLHEALRRAKLCSHDPVCGRQHAHDGTPGRALLGAACHGCLFIAECSCERSNQYLDRALVVPTMGIDHAEQLAFFAAPAL